MRTTILLPICLLVAGCASRSGPESRQDRTALGFPSYPPIRDADPQVREKRKFQVPARLIVVRSEDRIAVSVDMKSLEEIELECGSRVLVPVEVARVWGQSVEEPEAPEREETIQPEPTDSDEARPDSSETRAELSEALDLGDHTNDLDDLQAFMRDREVFRAARNKARKDKFLFETLGRIPDAQ